MQNVKGEKISMACAACGHVTPVDLRHKVTKYILKNPPSAASAKYNTKYGPVLFVLFDHCMRRGGGGQV